MAMLPALPRPEYGTNEIMVLDNNVLVGEIVDAIADNQQMVPGFEEFMNTMQSISNSLTEISIGLSELNSRSFLMLENVLDAEEIKQEQVMALEGPSDTSVDKDKDKLFTTLETLVSVSFLTLEAIRDLPNKLCTCFGKTVEQDQKAEELLVKNDDLSLKEKEIESALKITRGGLPTSKKDGMGGFLKTLLTMLAAFFIGFFAEGGSLSKLASLMFDKLIEIITTTLKNLFNSLFTAIKDMFIGFVINPIISVLNKIPGVDIEPLMTTEEKARAAGENTTGTDQIGSEIEERLGAKALLKGTGMVGNAALAGKGAYDLATKTPAERKAAEAAAKKFGLKTALKKIPLLGAAFGTAFAAQRALEGDYAGAAAEFGSGVAGAVGLAPVGLAIDLGLAASDTYGYTGPGMVQARNDFGATPTAEQLNNNLGKARQSTEEARQKIQQPKGGDVSSVVVGGSTVVNPTRQEIIGPPPEAGKDWGVWKDVK